MENIYTITAYIFLGSFLGMVGQSIRIIVGIKKKCDDAFHQCKEMKDWFDSKRLIVSLIIGAVAGSLGAISMLDTTTKINKEYLIMLISIGYTGTDFIEGLIKTRFPQSIPAIPTATKNDRNNITQ